MPRKTKPSGPKTSSRISKTAQGAASLLSDKQTVDNNLGAALGIGGGLGNLGFTGNPASPYSEPLSQTSPLFKNLRWYLVSNFRQLLSELYVEIGLVQTIVDVPVDDALRGGVMLKSQQLDEGQIMELTTSLDRDDDLNTAGQAAKWNRLYGGAGILILTDQDPEAPLDVQAITKDSNLEFRAVDMWELFWDKQNTEGYDPTIQTEEFDFYNYYASEVHKSRVMRLKGLTAPSFIRPRLRGWGFSVVEVLVRSINQYLKATDLSYEVLDEFKLDVYKVKNLVNTLLSPNGQTKIQQRMQTANLIKNYQNAIVMDSEDDFDHKQLSFSGLAEVMSGIRMQVASDMRMPITKLFGTSVSAGFSTDQNDMENYNSMVESQVRNKLKYDILRICEIKCQKLFGFIPDDLSVAFKPLRELTAEQEENVKTQKFNRLLQASERAMISQQEFRDACNKGNLFDVTLDTPEDLGSDASIEEGDLVKEGMQADPEKPLESVDVSDPGANREDTRKPRAWDKGAAPQAPMTPVEREKKESDGELLRNENELSPFTSTQKMRRMLQNSAEFDLASYEADGGDGWFDMRRKPFFENPKDPGLWKRCEEETRAVYGRDHFPFTLWLYKKLNGGF